jgi:hypothetical protein
MVTTRKIAAALNGVSTGCGIGWVTGLLQAPAPGLLRTASRWLYVEDMHGQVAAIGGIPRLLILGW